MQGLVRSLKTKDQTIQESGVKIELMERRMEAVKKQADTIVDLESELTKARKQERTYEEAMEQLQADLDALEQDNVKLKSMSTGHERQGMSAYAIRNVLIAWLGSVQMVDPEPVALDSNLETSHLLEQARIARVIYHPLSNFIVARGFAWNGSIPSKRELVPQRPRLDTRD